MSFFVRKLLAELLMPLPVLLFVGAAGWVLWVRGKRERLGRGLVAASLLGLALLSIEPVSGGLIRWVEGPPSAFPGDSVGFVVVLGHGHDSNPALPVSARPEPEAVYRIAEGVRIAHEQPWATLILSGYEGRDARAHADVAADLARALRIEQHRIVTSGEATTTAEEARILESLLTGQRFALVTSAWHMPRAAALFRARGLTPVEAPTGQLARVPGGAYAILGLVPNPDGLTRVRAAWSETLSRTWARLSGDL